MASRWPTRLLQQQDSNDERCERIIGAYAERRERVQSLAHLPPRGANALRRRADREVVELHQTHAHCIDDPVRRHSAEDGRRDYGHDGERRPHTLSVTAMTISS